MKISLIAIAIIAVSFFYFRKSEPEYSQEEIQREEVEVEENHFTISYHAQNEDEANIIDILWIKEAARVAADKGISHFNILEQRVQYNEERLPVLHGTIELSSDPMNSDFDANVILELPVLEETPQHSTSL